MATNHSCPLEHFHLAFLALPNETSSKLMFVLPSTSPVHSDMSCCPNEPFDKHHALRLFSSETNLRLQYGQPVFWLVLWFIDANHSCPLEHFHLAVLLLALATSSKLILLLSSTSPVHSDMSFCPNSPFDKHQFFRLFSSKTNLPEQYGQPDFIPVLLLIAVNHSCPFEHFHLAFLLVPNDTSSKLTLLLSSNSPVHSDMSCWPHEPFDKHQFFRLFSSESL